MPAVSIGGLAHPIDAEDFKYRNVTDKETLKAIGDVGGRPMCVSAIRGFGNSWVIGTPFLQSYYTVFHWGEIYTGNEVGKGAAVRFARAVHKA